MVEDAIAKIANNHSRTTVQNLKFFLGTVYYE